MAMMMALWSPILLRSIPAYVEHLKLLVCISLGFHVWVGSHCWLGTMNLPVHALQSYLENLLRQLLVHQC